MLMGNLEDWKGRGGGNLAMPVRQIHNPGLPHLQSVAWKVAWNRAHLPFFKKINSQFQYMNQLQTQHIHSKIISYSQNRFN